eukprot:TRINITY_DN47718_c0_g1_i1.p1 TRINITY_DN47718_c0_g1~~TRINITY_DN47718_c0_g1_i1.p1  ORF type:complete len:317 (+),score=34.59 TRINITY_DN47718_c0_g1_i1:104-1054(+)
MAEQIGAADTAPPEVPVYALPLQAPPLKTPLPSFASERTNSKPSYGEHWPEHLSKKDPFALWRRGPSQYQPPAAFDPFEEWRPKPTQRVAPDSQLGGLQLGSDQPLPYSAGRRAAALDELPLRTGWGSGNVSPLSEPPAYRHPEQLLPGPPLRHEASAPRTGYVPASVPSEPPAATGTGYFPGRSELGTLGAEQTAAPEEQTFATALMSWFRPSTATQIPSGQDLPAPPAQTLAPRPPPGTLSPGAPSATLPPRPPSGTLAPGSMRAAGRLRQSESSGSAPGAPPPGTLGPHGQPMLSSQRKPLCPPPGMLRPVCS